MNFIVGNNPTLQDALLKHYCSKSICLTLELSTFTLLTNMLMSSNGHGYQGNSDADALLLDSASATLFKESMKQCIDPMYIPMEAAIKAMAAREIEKSKNYGKSTTAQATGVESDDLDSLDDIDLDSSESSDIGTGSFKGKPKKKRNKQQQLARPLMHYEHICTECDYKAFYRSVSKLALFRDTQKACFPFLVDKKNAAKLNLNEATFQEEVEPSPCESPVNEKKKFYNFDDIKNGVAQAIHVNAIKVRQ